MPISVVFFGGDPRITIPAVVMVLSKIECLILYGFCWHDIVGRQIIVITIIIITIVIDIRMVWY